MYSIDYESVKAVGLENTGFLKIWRYWQNSYFLKPEDRISTFI